MDKRASTVSIGIAICTMDRPDDIALTLAAVAAQSRPVDEIVIVDASRRQIVPPEHYAGLAPAVPIAVLRAPPGLTRQRNIAIDHTDCQVLLFLDDDCSLRPHYVAELETAMAIPSSRTVGGAMGRIVETGCSRLRSRLLRCYKWLFLLGGAGKGTLVRSGLPTFPFWSGVQTPRPVAVMSGAQMAYRREVLHHYRFDERLSSYSYMEDVDMSYRVSRQYDLLYCPTALAEHRVAPASRLDSRTKYQMRVLNQAYLMHKNLAPRGGDWLAMLWSQLGLGLLLAMKRDWPGVLGTVDGWARLAAVRRGRGHVDWLSDA